MWATRTPLVAAATENGLYNRSVLQDSAVGQNNSAKLKQTSYSIAAIFTGVLLLTRPSVIRLCMASDVVNTWLLIAIAFH